MKKIHLLLFPLVVSVSAFGQETSFGIKAGVNYSTISGDASGVESKIGFHAGVFGIIKPIDALGIQPEMVFSRQGAQASANNDVKFHYDYLNIPVMLNFYPTETFFLQAGPQLGFLVSAKATDGNQTEDIKSQLNTTDFSLGLGMGFDLSHTVIGFRFNLGLNSTSDDEDATYPNQVAQVSVGFKF